MQVRPAVLYEGSKQIIHRIVESHVRLLVRARRPSSGYLAGGRQPLRQKVLQALPILLLPV